MLVEFSVTNFRSFKNKQTLSMVTDNKKIAIDTDFKRVPYLLKKVSILGPNASGKSNLILAMDVVIDFIQSSHKSDIGELIDVEPYLLNKSFREKPSEFEFTFLLDNVLYQYGFACTSKEITEEWLFLTRKGGNSQKWIARTENDKKENWYITSHLKGRRKEWIAETRENTLLLSLIGTLKNNEIMRSIIEFFNIIVILKSSTDLPSVFTEIISIEDEGMKNKVLEFLKKADLGIIGLEIEESEMTNEYIESFNMPEDVKKQMKEFLHGKKATKSNAIHLTEDNELVKFDFKKHESKGTKLLFALAVPIITILEAGAVLIVDEIGNSMHFKELEFIESLFANKETNPKGAQLIVTTHDVTVLSRSARDEIYFVDKTDGFSSQLYPLSDYEKRNDVPYLKRYLSGSYDALPHIGMGV